MNDWHLYKNSRNIYPENGFGLQWSREGHWEVQPTMTLGKTGVGGDFLERYYSTDV